MALSATELKVLNDLSIRSNAAVKLGDIIAGILGLQCSSGTPVNDISAKATLNVTGVVVDGETVTIDNPTKVGTDVYEFLADTAQTKSAPTNIPVNITASTTKSSGTLTMDTQPTSGDTVTIGTKVYTFVPVGTDTADGEVSRGANLAGAQAALVAAINGSDGVSTPHPLVTAAAFAGNASVITAKVGGVAGNSIATTETFTAASNVFAATTLGSGANCSAANAITALVAAITAADTQGVGAEDGTGDTVVLTADVGGPAGNDIAISKSMTNGAFAESATKLAGGVNGTPSDGIEIMVDTTNLYICLAANPLTGKNWRKIQLSSL